MLAQNAQRSLETAAAKTLVRIQTDQSRVDGRLRPLLEHIESHLFDPGLDVNQLKRRCGVRDNSVPIQFHAKLGLPPHAYIEDCRLRTACRLLRDTELKIWQIASLLGYSSIQVFSRAFTRWAQTRPTLYRRTARRDPSKLVAQNGVVAAKAASVAVAAPGREVRNLKLALDGALDAKQADRLIRRLLNLYPATGLLLERVAAEPRMAAQAPVPTFRASVRPRTNGHQPALAAEPIRTMPLPPLPGPDYRRLLTLEEIETVRAEALWEQIKDLPQDEMRTAIQESSGWETGALFELVRVRSMVDGRDNRKRGVEIAALLLDIPDSSHKGSIQSPETARQASAWTWIGNARRLAWDFSGAEEALGLAGKLLAKEPSSPGLYGDLAFVRSNHRMFQRRFGEALEQATAARGFYESAGKPDRRARALAQRAAVLKEMGRYQECIDDASEALTIFERGGDKHMALVVYSVLGRCYSNADRFSDALAVIRKARDVAGSYSDSEFLLKFAWLEAEVITQAGDLERGEYLYSDVIAAFIRKERPGDAASAALELACTQWSHGKDASVVETLRDVIPAFERLQMKQDALAALRLLEQAAARSALSKALFDSARAAIELR